MPTDWGQWLADRTIKEVALAVRADVDHLAPMAQSQAFVKWAQANLDEILNGDWDE